MLLDYYGIKEEERTLRSLLKVTPYKAGDWFFVELGLESIGLHFYWSYGFSFDELKELVKNNTPVIVSLKFSAKHSNHTVVVTDVTNEFVTIHDPERGENIKIDVKQFLEAWSNRGYITGYLKKA